MRSEGNIGNTAHLTDRGDKSVEELEASMGPEAISMVSGMANKIIKANKKRGRKFYSRNRRAWDRMNRPSKLHRIEQGLQRMYNLIEGKGFTLDPVVPEVTKETEV